MKNNIKSNNQTNFLLQNNYVNDPNNMINPQKKPRKKCNCSGRDAKVDADLYFQLKEENFKLKQDRKIQDERMKKLEVSLANIKENLIKERKQADYKVITNNNDTNSDLEKTKMENRKLKSENEKKNMIIQGLQSNALIIKAKGKSKNKKKERDPLKFQNEKNDYLACISRLREQLKIANEDRRTLIAELRSKQISFNPSSNNKNIMNDRITSQIQTASIKIDTNDKILELTKFSPILINISSIDLFSNADVSKNDALISLQYSLTSLTLTFSFIYKSLLFPTTVKIISGIELSFTESYQYVLILLKDSTFVISYTNIQA